MTSPRFLHSTADLDAAIAASEQGPIAIFKHSLTCGTSAMAAEEMGDLGAIIGDAAPLYQVVVQRSREVSWEIERRFGIRHESPQVLIVKHGQVVWHASHYRVTADAIREALAAA